MHKIELLYVIILNIVCIALGVIGLYKVPLSALFGTILSLTIVYNEILTGETSDLTIRMFSIIVTVMCAVCFIGGWTKDN